VQTKSKVFLGVTAAFLLVIGGEFAYIHHKNNEEVPVVKSTANQPTIDPDDNVFLKKMYPSTLKDERDLIGKTIWVSAAAQLDYYPYANHRADYAHPVTTLPGAEPMIVTGVFEQVPPKTGRPVMRISAGQRHVLLSFTLPHSANPKAEYAVPVGNFDNGSYTFLTDNIFFYDDPHKLYDFWGPVMWAHIDKHEPAIGMTENQAMMSLGQVMEPHGDKIGERTVTYDNNGKPITLDFRNGKAVSITHDPS
jgi:hypothetical protein